MQKRIKIISCWIIFFALSVKPVEADLETHEKDSLKSSIGVNLGIGPSYGFYGLGLTWDTRFFGISLHTGIYRFPENMSLSLKYNHYIEDATVIFSPSLSFGHRNGMMILLPEREGHFWGSGDLCFTNFVNQHFYLQNQIGLGYSSDRSIILKYGICLGYQFRGTLFGTESYRKNLGFKVLGFSLSTAFIGVIGLIDTYLSIMATD